MNGERHGGILPLSEYRRMDHRAQGWPRLRLKGVMCDTDPEVMFAANLGREDPAITQREINRRLVAACSWGRVRTSGRTLRWCDDELLMA